MKHFKALFALAVIAAAVMPTACETGMADSGLEAADVSVSGALNTKKIAVKFVVCNGGWGLVRSEGIVSPADDSSFIYNSASWAGDFHIAIPVANEDSYVNIRWTGTDAMSRIFLVKGKLPVKEAGRYAVVLDFNEEKNTDGWEVDTQNLEEVYEYGPGGTHEWLAADWKEAKSKAVRSGGEAVFEEATEPAGGSAGAPLLAGAAGTKTIKVKFEVKNGGGGLIKSGGIVSTQNDSYLVYDWDWSSYDFTIKITVPASDEYLNIRWKGEDYFLGQVYAKAKMKPDTGTITLDYNGFSYQKPQVAVKNLYDVQLGSCWGPQASPFKDDWENAKKRSVKN